MPANAIIRPARPTVNIDGQDHASLTNSLISLEIVEHFDGLYRAEATFGNWGNQNSQISYLYFDRQALDFGKTLKIKMDSNDLFEGRIMGMEARYPEGRSPLVSVLVEDAFQDLRMTRRTRTFFNVSDEDVFNQIASDHGLSPDLDLNGPTYAVLAQLNQSDLAFLRERARGVGAELWIDSDGLHAKPRSSRSQSSSIRLSYGGGLHQFSALADLATQCTSLVVSGWDVSSKNALNCEATASLLGNETQGGKSGPDLLNQVAGSLKETVAQSIPLNSDEAQAMAEAHFRNLARRFVVGKGTAETSSGLRVGATVDLDQLGPLFNGKYYLSEVHHLFDGVRGIRTEFVGERPWIGQ